MASDLTLEKLKIDERLRAVEVNVAEARPIRQKILDSLKKIDTSYERIDLKLDAHEIRLTKIEGADEARQKSMDNIMKIAIGSLTMAIGAAVMWFLKFIKFTWLGMTIIR